MAQSVRILDLRPAQFSVGMYEVTHKLNLMQAMKASKLKKYIRSKVVPVVVGPAGNMFILDRHHFLTAAWMFGLKHCEIDIREDFSRSRMSFAQFWQRMRRNKWCHLYDQFGEGPHSPIYLPHNVRGLADDPYRSLAWVVRKEGAFENTDISFAEFSWANFFRARRLLDRKFKLDIEGTLKRAVRLAQSSSAQHLPGWTGRG